ncbi:hypothetical protein LXL04_020290 [Taraxacum kok-saghyz]
MSNEEQSSFIDQSAISENVMAIKNQNCTVSLDSSLYPDSVKILIECLKASILNTALTAKAKVSISLLTEAYSSAKFDSVKNIVEFEMENGTNIAISQESFVKILNLSTAKNLIDSKTVINPDMIKTINQMGHTPILTRLSGFKKNKLPSSAWQNIKLAQNPQARNETTAKFREVQIGKLVVKSDSCDFIGRVPEAMLMKIDQENPICTEYLEKNPLPHPEREIQNEFNQLIEKKRVVLRVTFKRKATTTIPTTATSSLKKKKSRKSHL